MEIEQALLFIFACWLRAKHVINAMISNNPDVAEWFMNLIGQIALMLLLAWVLISLHSIAYQAMPS